MTVANEGAQFLGTFEKHPHLGGQSPPSEKFLMRVCGAGYTVLEGGSEKFLMRVCGCRIYRFTKEIRRVQYFIAIVY